MVVKTENGKVQLKGAKKYPIVENAVTAFGRDDFAESLRLLKEASRKHPELPPAHVI